MDRVLYRSLHCDQHLPAQCFEETGIRVWCRHVCDVYQHFLVGSIQQVHEEILFVCKVLINASLCNACLCDDLRNGGVVVILVCEFIQGDPDERLRLRKAHKKSCVLV